MHRGPARLAGGRGRFIAVVVCLAAAGAAFGHDLWLVPGKYRLELGEPTRVFINSGDVFPESLHLVGGHRLAAATVHGPGWAEGKHSVEELRIDGKSLTFDLAPPAVGTHVLGIEIRARTVRLKPEDFADYLSEEKLDAMAALREELGESTEPAVERYTKWAKAVVEVVGEAEGENGNGGGNESSTVWSEPIGHTIEIVPRAHPNRVAPGGSLPLDVRFRGEPLAGAIVVGSRAGGASERLEAVTNEEGQAEVSIPSPGRWYLRTIHMVRVEDDPEIRWESFWCTLSFEVRDRASEEEESR